MSEDEKSHYSIRLSACAQSCPTLCDPLNCSPSGSSVRGISRARILGWVAIPYSRDALYNLHSRTTHCLVSLECPPKERELPSQASLVPPGIGAWPLLAAPRGNGNGAAAQSTRLLMEAGRKGTTCRAGRFGASSPHAVVSRTLKGVGGTLRNPPTPRSRCLYSEEKQKRPQGRAGKRPGQGPQPLTKLYSWVQRLHQIH